MSAQKRDNTEIRFGEWVLPGILEKFKTLDPGAPEAIFARAEDLQRKAHKREKTRQWENISLRSVFASMPGFSLFPSTDYRQKQRATAGSGQKMAGDFAAVSACLRQATLGHMQDNRITEEKLGLSKEEKRNLGL